MDLATTIRQTSACYTNMMSQREKTYFDWQTESEERPEAVGNSAENPPSPQHRWWWLLLPLVLIAFGVVRSQVSKVADEQKSELIAVHQLLVSASETLDRELFDSLVQAEDQSWVDRQWLQLRPDSLVDEIRLGLSPIGLPQVIAVEMAADFKSADLIQHTIYQRDDTTLTLAQTLHFEKVEDRWLLTPPPTLEWGELQTFGRAVSIKYPVIDEDFFRAWHMPFRNRVNQLCETSQMLNCPTEGKPFIVHFVALEPIRGLGFNERNALLPTLSLLGTPATEADEAKMLAIYSDLAMAAFMSQNSAMLCCPPFGNALQVWAGVQEGVMTWEFSAEHYADLYLQNTTLLPLHTPFAGYTPNDIRFTYILVEFIMESDPQLTVEELARTLTESTTPYEWLTKVTALHDPALGLGQSWIPPHEEQNVDQAIMRGTDHFQRFLIERSGRFIDPVPAVGSIVATCVQDGRAQLVQHELGTQEWETLYESSLTPSDRGMMQLVKLPHGDGVLLTISEDEKTEDILWRAGRVTPVDLGQIGRREFVNDHLITLNFIEQEPFFRELDLTQCENGECAIVREWEGEPIYSPTGRWVVLNLWSQAIRNNLLIVDVNSPDAPPITELNGRTQNFIWVDDDNTLIYNDRVVNQLMRYTIGEEEPTVLLDLALVREEMAPDLFDIYAYWPQQDASSVDHIFYNIEPDETLHRVIRVNIHDGSWEFMPQFGDKRLTNRGHAPFHILEGRYIDGLYELGDIYNSETDEHWELGILPSDWLTIVDEQYGIGRVLGHIPIIDLQTQTVTPIFPPYDICYDAVFYQP